MRATRVITLRNILSFAAIVEIGTAVGLLVDPAIVVALLVRGEISDNWVVLARTLGITLLALGLACWPQRRATVGGSATPTALRGMLAYNGLVALYLGYAGLALHLGGPLLWPAVALHALVAVLLVWTRRDASRGV
jgi:hypothetical protein